MNTEKDKALNKTDASRSSFFQYLKNLIEIHGEQSFGVYEATTENTNGDQKVILHCCGWVVHRIFLKKNFGINKQKILRKIVKI